MNRIWLPIALIVAVVIVAVVDFRSTYPQLPARIASHFDAHGNPNGWMTKSQFMTTTIGTLFIAGWMFVLLPAILWFAPTSVMNIPNRDYWLAPEREPTARRMIIERMLWFMAATLALLAHIYHGVLKANLPPAQRLEPWWPLGCYLAFLVIWFAEMIWAFRKPPTPAPPDDRRLIA